LRIKAFMLLIALVASASITISCRAAEPDTDILIYGGGFAACAAATTAATTAPEQQITLLVPYPEQKLGGIGTIGGQNFMDLRFWENNFVTKGSLYRWYTKAGRFYSTEEMAGVLEQEIKSHPNISIVFGRQIVATNTTKQKITNLTLQPVRRQHEGALTWTGAPTDMSARVYIDASEDGRLARLTGVGASVGRQGWPQELLPEDERDQPLARQQAATLMFKVRGVRIPSEQTTITGWQFVRDHTGSWGLAGGKNTFHTDPVLKDFNRTFGPEGFALKPVNAAQDGAGNDEWWINALLVFNMDGRARDMDRNTDNFPTHILPGSLTVDKAWQEARDFINRPEFIQAFRRFTVTDETGQQFGFQNAELVKDKDGKPVVGNVLYVRETIHAVNSPITGNGMEETNFALPPSDCQQAGNGPGNGADAENYSQRMGLAHYFMDVNAYIFEDLVSTGDFKWPVTEHARPEWAEHGQPENPVYLPYRMLISPDIQNLLLPGYATGASSLAWSQVRVLPNLAVLGDAAGAAAAVSVEQQITPGKFGDDQVKAVQQKLKQVNTRLDK